MSTCDRTLTWSKKRGEKDVRELHVWILAKTD